jgi:hypothetical protein
MPRATADDQREGDEGETDGWERFVASGFFSAAFFFFFAGAGAAV